MTLILVSTFIYLCVLQFISMYFIFFHCVCLLVICKYLYDYLPLCICAVHSLSLSLSLSPPLSLSLSLALALSLLLSRACLSRDEARTEDGHNEYRAGYDQVW